LGPPIEPPDGDSCFVRDEIVRPAERLEILARFLSLGTRFESANLALRNSQNILGVVHSLFLVVYLFDLVFHWSFG
jgi:hypothetical protein